MLELKCGWPQCHFYSPIPSIEDIKTEEEKNFNNIPPAVSEVDMIEEKQIVLLGQL